MPTEDWVAPLIYALIGALILFLAMRTWHRVQQRRTRKHSDTLSFDVRVIGDAHLPEVSERHWQWDSLTPRETEIARLVAQGERNAEIARDLHISVHTVETHLTHIYAKLQIRSRTELARVIRDLVD
jgi:DNA-binding CsgD family transcriptional regulator